MNPTAAWLKDTRERHHLSQEKLVDRINAWALAEGMTWTLHRPNYNGWERGKGITDPLRDRLIAYWVAQGEPEPDLTPVVVEPVPDLAQAIMALTTELAAWRQERADLLERVADLELLVAQRVGSSLPGEGPSKPHGHDAPRETAG